MPNRTVALICAAAKLRLTRSASAALIATVLPNGSDSVHGCVARVQSCCAQDCGQPVQTRRHDCAWPGGEVVDDLWISLQSIRWPATTLSTSCALKKNAAERSCAGARELSTPGRSHAATWAESRMGTSARICGRNRGIRKRLDRSLETGLPV